MALHLLGRNHAFPLCSAQASFTQILIGNQRITAADATPATPDAARQPLVCQLALTVAAGCWIAGLTLLLLSFLWPAVPAPHGLFFLGLCYAAIGYFNSGKRPSSLKHRQVTCRLVERQPDWFGLSRNTPKTQVLWRKQH